MTTTRLPVRRRPDRLTVVLLAIVLVMTVITAITLWNSRGNEQQATDNAAALAQQFREACERDPNLADEHGEVCRQAEEVEDEPSASIPGPAGPGPSDAQVANAVASYCAGGACRGQDGTDGVSVTPAQVAAAVSTYCNARGECQGPSGADGEDSEVPGPQGEPGVDGETIVGPQGPGPTSEQISAAVASFCANDACKGSKGDPGTRGTDGSNGSDGRGITDVACNDENDWVFTFDQEPLTQTVEGPCRFPPSSVLD